MNQLGWRSSHLPHHGNPYANTARNPESSNAWMTASVWSGEAGVAAAPNTRRGRSPQPGRQRLVDEPIPVASQPLALPSTIA